MVLISMDKTMAAKVISELKFVTRLNIFLEHGPEPRSWSERFWHMALSPGVGQKDSGIWPRAQESVRKILEYGP